MNSLKEQLGSNSYPGRGIVVGKSDDGKSAVVGYFIMGRSVNSRNRVFCGTEDGIKTEAFDPSLLSDPSLIIYNPVRVYENKMIVTNGDQTDTVFEGLQSGKTFEEALASREYEPDEPNFTPRISAMLTFRNGDFYYRMSILKKAVDSMNCVRNTFEYKNIKKGEARIIHTYDHDGNPIPTFSGEPREISLSGNIDDFTNELWNSLDSDNKVSLYTAYIDLWSRHCTTKIINKNEEIK